LPDEDFAFVGDGEVAGIVAVEAAAAGGEVDAEGFEVIG
jgi:hypothetical protein